MTEPIKVERVNNRLPALIFGLSWDFSLPRTAEEREVPPVRRGLLHSFINLFRRKPEATEDFFQQQVKVNNLKGEDLEMAAAFWAKRDQLANLDARALILSGRTVTLRMTPALPELLDGAITSTGDDTTGSGDGDDERLTLQLGLLPREVDHVVLYIDTIPASPLSEYRNPVCHLSYGRGEKVILSESLDTVLGTTYVLAILRREGEDFVVVPVKQSFAKPNQAGFEEEVMGLI